MKVFIFTSMKILKHMLTIESNSKIVFRIWFFRLNSKISNDYTCYGEEERLHASRVEEESSQSGDYGILFFSLMININAHPSCQVVHQQCLVSKSPTSVMVSHGINSAMIHVLVLSAKWGGTCLKMSGYVRL